VSDVSGYSEIANDQLDEIEDSGDPGLCDAILVVCEFVLDHPAEAQSRSSALTTKDGICFRLSVPGQHPYKIFWTRSRPRIEAVFPYP
jgi:hypothetical protein